MGDISYSCSHRHQEANDVIFSNSLDLAMRPCSAATYGMQGRPCLVNTMTLLHKKSPDGLDEKDQYFTPPNTYDRSDFYSL